MPLCTTGDPSTPPVARPHLPARSRLARLMRILKLFRRIATLNKILHSVAKVQKFPLPPPNPPTPSHRTMSESRSTSSCTQASPVCAAPATD